MKAMKENENTTNNNSNSSLVRNVRRMNQFHVTGGPVILPPAINAGSYTNAQRNSFADDKISIGGEEKKIKNSSSSSSKKKNTNTTLSPDSQRIERRKYEHQQSTQRWQEASELLAEDEQKQQLLQKQQNHRKSPRASSVPRKQNSVEKDSNQFDSHSPSPRSIATSTTPRPLTAHRSTRSRSSSPATLARSFSDLSRSTSALTRDEYSHLQSLSHSIDCTRFSQEKAAHQRPIVFQPKNAVRNLYATHQQYGLQHTYEHEGYVGSLIGVAAQARPDQQGLFFSTEAESTHSASSSESYAGTSVTALLDWSLWPPIQPIDAVQEKVVRTWLSDDLGLFVLASQENGRN